jgi:diguanylate cyclase (GGDEF)-like protein
MRIIKHRLLVARTARLSMAACGMVAGNLLGCVLALHLAENWLDQYSNLIAAEENASSGEARSLLAVLKKSPYPFCSDAEIAYFRDLVFRSEFLKDAGRIHGGKIVCSATAGLSTRSIGQFKPSSPQQDGTIAYSNLVPVRDDSLKRAGLQLDNAYVVFGSHVPASLGPIPMHLTVTMKDAASQQTGDSAGAALPGNGPDLTTDGTVRLGDTFYATRCSTLYFNCVTASTSVSEALQGERNKVVGGTVLGGLIGYLLSLALSLWYNRSQDTCQQLRRAIVRDKLEVAYQPIVNLATRRIVGAEALSRWTNEEGDAVGPDVFIKIAEEHGFIGLITKSVVRHTLHDFGQTFRDHPDFRISVNVAAADLADPKFLPMLDDALRRTEVQPKSLVIEITERSTSESIEATETIRLLRRRGHSIHIDDFGTGYSNLDKLLYLFADTIKIDKAFTRVIGTDAVTVAIIPQILSMAKSLNLEVVVEGIETDHQAEYFSQATQTLYGQGWLFGHPVKAEEFHRLLAEDWVKALAPERERGLKRLVEEKTADLLRTNEELSRLSFTDSLTGLKNRRVFDQTLETECARLTRSGAHLSLISIDVDYFKALNDSQGHLRGDECLVMLGVELMKIARRHIDVVARCGGEEFGIILPETDTTGAARVAESVRLAIANLKVPHPASLVAPFLTVSVGVATATQDRYCTPNDLADAADRALYAAKRAGRNRVCEAYCEVAC